MKLFRNFVILILLLSFTSVPVYAKDGKIALSTEEKQFIQEHPVIYLCVDPEFVPYEF